MHAEMICIAHSPTRTRTERIGTHTFGWIKQTPSSEQTDKASQAIPIINIKVYARREVLDFRVAVPVFSNPNACPVWLDVGKFLKQV